MKYNNLKKYKKINNSLLYVLTKIRLKIRKLMKNLKISLSK